MSCFIPRRRTIVKKSKENVIWQRNCRVIATVMLLIAIAFIGYALTHPEAGSVFYIGNFEVGVAEMIAFYKFYAAIMIVLFCVSFVPKRK